MFSVIVLFHEYWHFFFARLFWVKVEEFWLGIPPRYKKIFTDKKWTIFSLNTLPLWGFVRLKGESWLYFSFYTKDGKKIPIEKVYEYIKKEKDIYDSFGKTVSKFEIQKIEKQVIEGVKDDNLFKKKYWQQSLIILWGVLMNFLLSIVLFSGLFMFWVAPIGINDKIQTNVDVKLIPTLESAIKEGFIVKKQWVRLYPIKNSIAETAWIWEWDLVNSVNWEDITSVESFIVKVSQQKNIPMMLDIETSTGVKKSIRISPNSEWKIWSYVSENLELNKNFTYKFWFLEAVKNGIWETYNQSLLTFQAFTMLMKNIIAPEKKEDRTEAINSISWPIWVVSLVSKSVSESFILVIVIWALISVNLGVFNILPIPALDGWRLLFIWIHAISEKIVWKKAISLNVEAIIHSLFFLTLIALSIIIWYNDIIKFFW